MNQIRNPFCRVACVLFAAIVCLSITPEKAQAIKPRAVRQAQNAVIKSMPIMARPNRPGHFYGNSVRRVYYRTNGRVNIEQMRPKRFIGDL